MLPVTYDWYGAPRGVGLMIREFRAKDTGAKIPSQGTVTNAVLNKHWPLTINTISNNPLLLQHIGLSGRTYTIEHILQEEVSPPRQVYRAL